MLISIITVVFNDCQNFMKTVESILALTVPEELCFEFIVIDGNSTDGTFEIINDLHKKKIISKYISEDDSGIYDAMNKGVELSIGDWIVFLNAGDVFFDQYILYHINESINSYSGVNFLYGKHQANQFIIEQRLSLIFLISHMINHQSIFYHRSLFKNNLYDETYKFCADYAHLLSVFHKLKPQFVNHIFCKFDTHGVSSLPQNRSFMWKERLRAVWCSDLSFLTKILLSVRGVGAFPYQKMIHIFRGIFKSD